MVESLFLTRFISLTGQPLLDLLIRQVVPPPKNPGMRHYQLVQVPNQQLPMTRGAMHRNLLHRHPLRPVLKLQLIILLSKNLETSTRLNLQWRGELPVFRTSNRMPTFKFLAFQGQKLLKGYVLKQRRLPILQRHLQKVPTHPNQIQCL